jgi:pimeloyl-ACP methyl ester carboxylesterase
VDLNVSFPACMGDFIKYIFIPPVYAEHFAAQMTNVTVHIVPDAAHMVVYEQPRVVAGLINRLLAR